MPDRRETYVPNILKFGQEKKHWYRQDTPVSLLVGSEWPWCNRQPVPHKLFVPVKHKRAIVKLKYSRVTISLRMKVGQEVDRPSAGTKAASTKKALVLTTSTSS